MMVAARPAGCLRWPAYTALHQLAHAVVVQGITEAGQGVVLRTLAWRLCSVFAVSLSAVSRWETTALLAPELLG